MTFTDLNEPTIKEATHLLDCVHSYNRRSRYEYTMPCKILKVMPDGRRKVLVFGDRMRESTKAHIRYVEAYKVKEKKR